MVHKQPVPSSHSPTPSVAERPCRTTQATPSNSSALPTSPRLEGYFVPPDTSPASRNQPLRSILKNPTQPVSQRRSPSPPPNQHHYQFQPIIHPANYNAAPRLNNLAPRQRNSIGSPWCDCCTAQRQRHNNRTPRPNLIPPRHRPTAIAQQPTLRLPPNIPRQRQTSRRPARDKRDLPSTHGNPTRLPGHLNICQHPRRQQPRTNYGQLAILSLSRQGRTPTSRTPSV